MSKQTYKELYSRLNANQKEAVDCIDGPLLILAGPGTGKTQVLSLRIANILLKTDINPENILCLTFSESASKEMKNRLNYIIGNEASNINVSTFHSFGKEIIESDLITHQYSDYKAINDHGKKHLILNILQGLNYKNKLNSNEQVDSIAKLISDFKKADISSQQLDKIIAINTQFLNNLNSQIEKFSQDLSRISKGSIKIYNQIEEIIRKIDYSNIYPEYNLKNILITNLTKCIDEFNELNSSKVLTKFKAKFLTKNQQNLIQFKGIKEYDLLNDFNQIYQELLNQMARLKIYDYDDMIVFALKTLKENQDLKFNLQEKYQYILIDEYQDTNISQAELIKQLTDNPIYNGQPNVMAVGDDDQAIYAFQGAQYSNMIDFYNTYKQTKIIPINENYRSSQEIIDLFNQISSQIESRLINEIKGVDKTIRAGKTNQNDNTKIERINFNTEEEQYSFLVKSLLKDYKTNQNVAVLTPRHKELEKLASLLEEKNINLNYEHQENVLDSYPIKQIYYMLKLILAIKNQNEHELNAYFPIVLNLDFLEIDQETIWEISYQARINKKFWLKEVLNRNATRPIGLFFMKLSLIIDILNFDQIIDYLIGLDEIHYLDNGKNKIYHSNFLKYLQKDKLAAIILISNLTYLRNVYDEFIPGNSNQRDTLRFVEMFEELSGNDQTLNNTILFKELSNISLMTVYGSKGLEFDKVYLISLIDERWGKKQKNNNKQIKVPSNLEPIINVDQNSIDQKLRLLYVALSRAKKGLMLTSFNYSDTQKINTPLTFLNEYRDDQGSLQSTFFKKDQIQNIASFEVPLNQYIKEHQLPYRKLKFSLEDKDILKRQLDEFKLSPTSLTDFLNIAYSSPEKYFYRHVLLYPSVKTEQTLYGSAIHQTLEWFQNEITLKKEIIDIKLLLKNFQSNLKKQNFNKQIFQKLLEKGKQALINYYKINLNKFSFKDKAEYSFANKNILLNNKIKLTGKIDLLSENNHTLLITDFKTSSKTKLKWEKNVSLYNYQKQLYFYRVLLEESKDFNKFEDIKARLVYLHPEINQNNNELYFDYDNNELLRTKSLIEIIWNKTMNLEIPETNKYPKDYKGIISFENDLLNKKI